MEIQKGSILNVDNDLYKVYGESKLYWLTHQFKIEDQIELDDSVLLCSMKQSTFKKFSYITEDEKVKFPFITL